MELNQYLKTVESGASLARKVGVSPGFISHWVTGFKQVPAERCLAIERATAGAVRCETLRPDVDWAAIRGTKKRTK